MQDAHHDQFHRGDQQRQSLQLPTTETLGKDDIQSLLFDLVRADRTAEVELLLGQFNAMTQELQRKLVRLASSSASGMMMEVLYKVWVQSAPKSDVDKIWLFPLRCAVQSKRLDLIQWILDNVDTKLESRLFYPYYSWFSENDSRLHFWDWAIILQSVLESDSEDIWQSLFPEFDREFTAYREGERVAPVARAMGRQVVRATARRPDREARLILLWEKIQRVGETDYLSRCLKYVAETCYSIPLAKVLLHHGATVDFRGTGVEIPPLQCALRRSSLEAAEMARFLLYRGADPECRVARSTVKSIKDEIGAREISKWLGMSWDELVEKVKADRAAGICPEEFV